MHIRAENDLRSPRTAAIRHLNRDGLVRVSAAVVVVSGGGGGDGGGGVGGVGGVALLARLELLLLRVGHRRRSRTSNVLGGSFFDEAGVLVRVYNQPTAERSTAGWCAVCKYVSFSDVSSSVACQGSTPVYKLARAPGVDEYV